MGQDLTERVRAAYNEVSLVYRGDDDAPENYVAWVTELDQKLNPGSDVLDLGCGCGVPAARDLDRCGHRVTGVDISDVQIARARQLVPRARFIRADASDAVFEPESFDAVVCLYSLIHMPLETQPNLIRRCADFLRPGGWLLATTGERAWTGEEANWLGTTVTMSWSQADTGTYHKWLSESGFVVLEQELVPEGESGHSLFWARKR